MEDIPWSEIAIAGSTLIASLLGYLLAGANEARRDRRAVEREHTTRQEEGRAAALQARHEYQLATLLALQEAVQLMARSTARALHYDHMEARKGLHGQLPSELDAELLAHQLEVIKLRNRVLDDDLRTALEALTDASRIATLDTAGYATQSGEPLEHLALSHSAMFGEHARRTTELLGQHLRTELEWTLPTR